MLFFSLILFEAMNPIIASAIMPGWGEMILKRKNEARAFFIIEGSLWFSYWSFNWSGHKLESSSRAFAVNHAGANPARKDKEYFDNLEDYLSSEKYNLIIEREASNYYPDDPQRQQEYIRENGYFGEDEWQWDDTTNKVIYWEKRKSARENFRRATFITGFIIINRLISVINVAVFKEGTRLGFETNHNRLGLVYKF